jgi:hypothetical protein
MAPARVAILAIFSASLVVMALSGCSSSEPPRCSSSVVEWTEETGVTVVSDAFPVAGIVNGGGVLCYIVVSETDGGHSAVAYFEGEGASTLARSRLASAGFTPGEMLTWSYERDGWRAYVTDVAATTDLPGELENRSLTVVSLEDIP